MKQRIGVFATLVFAGAFVSPQTLQGQSEVNSESDPLCLRSALQVFVSNYAPISRADLKVAKGVATNIYDKGGVQVRWLDCYLAEGEIKHNPECLRLTPTTLVVRILPRSKAASLKQPPSALGFAQLDRSGGFGYYANVFYHRVEELSGVWSSSRPVVLGHVMAHEMGHLLLGRGHSRAGLMTANWVRAELVRVNQGVLTFTPQQAKEVRARSLERDSSAEASIPRRKVQGQDVDSANGPTISVQIYNWAKVSSVTLQKGQAVVGEIFKEAGVELRWVECPCEERPEPMSLALRIIPKLFGSTTSKFRSDHLGFAAVNEEGGELATVFYDRIESQTRGGDPSSLLGLAAAHELGHLLLGSKAHTDEGIMRHRWTRQDLRQAHRGGFRFSPEQSQTMRHRLVKSLELANRLAAESVSLGPREVTAR